MAASAQVFIGKCSHCITPQSAVSITSRIIEVKCGICNRTVYMHPQGGYERPEPPEVPALQDPNEKNNTANGNAR